MQVLDFHETSKNDFICKCLFTIRVYVSWCFSEYALLIEIWAFFEKSRGNKYFRIALYLKVLRIYIYYRQVKGLK